MNESRFSDLTLIETKISVQLPGTVSPSEAPNEIMWMPPSRHTITASQGGKPAELTVNVTEAGAHRVIAQHAKYMEAAAAGQGDLVFTDFNHEDREASAHVKAFRWAGDDPRTGGIRALVDWTGAGKRAVLGREFSRFSPSFYLDDKGEVASIPVNCGGLVNRAAFQRIAPVMSKMEETLALLGAPDFMAQAKVLARSRNLKMGDAYQVLAKKDPYLYDCYRYEVLGLGTKPKPLEESSYLARWKAAENDEFVHQARALSDALDIPLAQATTKLARVQPALFERYRAKLGLGNEREYQARVTAVHAHAEASEFMALSKRIAEQQSLQLVDACTLAARQRPDLYDAYRGSL